MGIDYEVFGAYTSKSREVDDDLDLVAPHLITRIDAPQAHPVPNKVTHAYGPFSPELLKEPEIVIATPAFNEDGSEFPLGATTQNNFKPPRYLRCSECMVRVLETETADHVCED